MAILVKNICKIIDLLVNEQITSFLMKIENDHNSAQKSPKSKVINWLSCGNIYSIPKINKIELEGKKGSKQTCKNRPIFCIEKIKVAFSQKFSKV